MAGNDAERQRYKKAMIAMNRVMSDPLHAEFRKTLPLNFKAADVLGQYRLFFRIINAVPPATENIIFFVWINDEDSIHRSGQTGDAYAVFRDLVYAGSIADYVPEAPTPNPFYNRSGDWGESAVYVSFEQAGRADSHLILNRVRADDYRIDSISVTAEARGLASGLLTRLCAEADQAKIHFHHELFVDALHYPKSRHLLQKFGFTMDDSDGDSECWIRTPK